MSQKRVDFRLAYVLNERAELSVQSLGDSEETKLHVQHTAETTVLICAANLSVNWTVFNNVFVTVSVALASFLSAGFQGRRSSLQQRPVNQLVQFMRSALTGERTG